MDEITRFRASSTATSSKAAGFNNGWNVPQSPFTSTTQMTTSTVEFRQRGQATTVQVDVNHTDISPKSAPSPIYHQAASKTPRLISWDELPAWHQDSPYILTGYRPISNSVPISIQSLLYLHNETLNIYTHLVPSILFFSLQFLTHNYFNAHYPNSSKWDIVMFSIFFLSAAICLGMSAAYHTLMNHSRIISEAMLRMDFVGIMVLILGKFISGIYVGFFCEPVLRSVYYTMILSLGSITTMVLVNPKYQGLKYRKFRLATFISTALSAFAPLAHSIRIFGWEQNWRQSGMPFYLTEGLILVIGSVFYSMRIPECYRPGRFDIVGASHQIFHVLVVAATVVHLYGLLQTYDYAYHHRVCKLV